jgi:hypothetical protein
MTKWKILMVLALSCFANSQVVASDKLNGKMSFSATQLQAVAFDPKAATQKDVSLSFTDPRNAGEVEKIVFDPSYIPPHQMKDQDGNTMSVSDFFLTTTIQYKGGAVSETALCDWTDATKATAACKIEDDGGGFLIKAVHAGSTATLQFVVQPKSQQTWGFRIAEFGKNEPQAIKVNALTTNAVTLPIAF